MKLKLTKPQQHILLLHCGILLALGIFYTLARLGIGIPCIFHTVTGLQCPGCGSSRAALSLLRLDFAGALSYNLLFPLEFGYILWVWLCACRNYLQGRGFSYRPPLPWIDAAILFLVVLWGILRNLV